MAKFFDAVLRLSTDKFIKPLEQAGKQMDDFQKKMSFNGKGFYNMGKGLESVGSSLMKSVTMPVVAGAGAVSAAAISFEDSFADVRKTVDATEDQFGQLEDAIISMSKEIPVSANEISQIMASGGQLGIYTENLEKFTRVVADLKVATNLGDEGADLMAKFANITGMDQGNFDRLGSTIVALGNNTATTEADIMAMAMRLAGAGSQVGMTEDQILGLSAALSSVGIEAEAGGSAMSKVMIKIASAVEQGGDSLEDLASVTGMSIDAFSRLFKADPAKALQGFIQGLGDTERNGKSTIVMLDELGLKEVRVRDTLLRATNASDLFNKTLDIGSQAWEDNTALAHEASEKYKTMQSRLIMLKNRVFALAKDFGELLLPSIEKLVDKGEAVLEWLSNLDDGAKENIINFAKYAAAIGPVIFVLGKVSRTIGKVFLKFGDLAGAIKKSGGLLKFLTMPWMKFIVIAGLVAAAVFLIIKNWDKIKAKAEEVFPGIDQTFANMWESIKTIFSAIAGFLGAFVEGAKVKMLAFFEAIQPVINFLAPMVKGVIDNVLSLLDGLLEFLAGVFTGNWEQIWHGLVKSVSSIFGGVVEVVKPIINLLIGMINKFISGLNKIQVPDFVPVIGGKGINIPEIPKLYTGTSNWPGGLAEIHDRGGEIVDLPRGSRVIPHDKSVSEAYRMGRSDGTSSLTVNIPKLADQVVFREEADMDKFLDKMAKVLAREKANAIGGAY